MKRELLRILLVAAIATTFAGFARGAEPSVRPPAAAATPQNDGEVRKVDREQGKLTLRHGPLQELDMPAMTMVFRVADPQLLDGLKEGDKVKFTAAKINGAYTLTAVQVVR